MNLMPTKSQCEVQSEIMKIILYFDIFSHPLRLDEIRTLVNLELGEEQLLFELDKLKSKGYIQEIQEYYLLHSAKKESISLRQIGESRAFQARAKAMKRAKTISSFPFVRSVLISGSFSKGVLAEDGDIDFFIITAANRLWIARSLLVAYKKVFLLNSRKFFCINYFIDADHLEIDEKNIFTAIELSTLLPLFDTGLIDNFQKKNSWIKSFVKGFGSSTVQVNQIKKPILSQIVEVIFQRRSGEILDNSLLWIMKAIKERKFRQMTKTDFKVALKTTKHHSKHHPRNFQKHVLAAFEERRTANPLI